MTLAELTALHTDAERCAEVAGLVYTSPDTPGLTRRRAGKGWAYHDANRAPLTDAEVKERLTALAIPPAWRKVWICPDPDGHILATGEDDRGRKQYIYHPRWRAIRDLLNFYRLILFAEQLSTIRSYVDRQLRRRTLDRARVIAAMIAILDETLVRIGNEVYAEENNSYGLSTLTAKHVTVNGATVTLEFPGKSGREWDVSFTDARVARVLEELVRRRPRQRVFTVDGVPIDSSDVNATLFAICGEHITAKSFRTWGGTLAAFTYLRDRIDSPRPAEKVAVEAIDEAAEALGNTRAVARAHYVHPHIVETYTHDTFDNYLRRSKPQPDKYLDESEQQLLAFLQVLFQHEFNLLEVEGKPVGAKA